MEDQNGAVVVFSAFFKLEPASQCPSGGFLVKDGFLSRLTFETVECFGDTGVPLAKYVGGLFVDRVEGILDPVRTKEQGFDVVGVRNATDDLRLGVAFCVREETGYFTRERAAVRFTEFQDGL